MPARLEDARSGVNLRSLLGTGTPVTIVKTEFAGLLRVQLVRLKRERVYLPPAASPELQRLLEAEAQALRRVQTHRSGHPTSFTGITVPSEYSG